MPENEQNVQNEQEQKIILQHQNRRRKHKIKLAVESIVIIIISIITIVSYFYLSKNEYNKYTEKAKVDYKVNLKENEFYEDDYLDEKNTIIASLIKDLEVEFKYNLNLEQDQDYTYSYKILAKTSVKESSRDNTIYETTQELLSKEVQESNTKDLEIAEKVTIDYNEYNEKINKFINVYKLDNTTSTLNLEMYVYVINKYDGEQINRDSKVMTLNIPLTTKTIDISINSNVIKYEGNILSKKSEYDNLTYMLGIGFVLLVIGVAILIKFIKYVLETRSAEKMYEQELKRILFNYKSYIQKINNEIDYNNYKIIQINTFNEILEMRDTMQSPILMYTEENEDRTKFMIMKDGILYLNVLGAKEIRNVLRARSAEKKAKENEKNRKNKKVGKREKH